MTFFNISVNKDIYHKTKKQKCDQNPDLAQPINGSAFKVFAQQADMKWNLHCKLLFPYWFPCLFGWLSFFGRLFAINHKFYIWIPFC